MRKNMKLMLAALAATALAACSGQLQQDTGSARLSISSRSSAASVALSDVTLTVRGPVASAVQPGDIAGLAAPLFGTYALGLPPASKTFDNLAVGWYYIDANSTGYQGHGWLQVVSHQLGSLSITMQEKNGPPVWSDAAPRIDSITVTPADPYYGQTVHLTLVASDANASCGAYGCTTDPLTYKWESKCSDSSYTGGTFSAATSSATDFTSSCHGTETLTITVTDSRGIFSGASAAIPYTAQGGTVDLAVNHFPTINNITSTDAQVLPGDQIAVTVDATDVDAGDTLTYEWTSTCGSVVVSNGGTTGTLTPAGAGDCTVGVKVFDGHGPYSYALGTLVAHAVDANLTAAPYIDVCNSTTWACTPVGSYAGASSYLDATGLHLTKNAADGGGVAFGPNAHILGVSGMTLSSASFDAVGTIGGGSPRFLLHTAAGDCALELVDAVVSGSTYTFLPTATCGGVLTGLDIIADMGGGVGAVTLTNIKVNGVSVH